MRSVCRLKPRKQARRVEISQQLPRNQPLKKFRWDRQIRNRSIWTRISWIHIRFLYARRNVCGLEHFRNPTTQKRARLNSSVTNGAMVSMTAFSSRVGNTSSEQDLSGRARTAVTISLTLTGWNAWRGATGDVVWNDDYDGGGGSAVAGRNKCILYMPRY